VLAAIDGIELRRQLPARQRSVPASARASAISDNLVIRSTGCNCSKNKQAAPHAAAYLHGRVELALRAIKGRDKMPDNPRLSDSRWYVSQGSGLCNGTGAEDQWDSREPSRNLRLNIVKWFVVAMLFASAALVTIAPFMWL
jgi:hypothetical protein